MHFSSLAALRRLSTIAPRGLWKAETGSGSKDNDSTNSCVSNVLCLLVYFPLFAHCQELVAAQSELRG